MPTFSTPQPISVTVELAIGSAWITASDRDDTVVEVLPSDPSRRADVEAAEQTQTDYASGELRITTPNRRFIGPSSKSGSVDVRIQLPTGSELQARGSMAAFRVVGALGECRLRTSMGDVELERTGPLELRTGFGTVSVGHVAGDAEVTTGSGQIRIGSVEGTALVKNHNGGTSIGDVSGELRVKAANGDISVGRAGSDVVASSANGDVRVDEAVRGTASLKTAMGEIEIGISAESAARLDAHTSFGCVRNLLDRVAGPEGAAQSLEVHARTSMGDVVVRRARRSLVD